jgi:hypothetical protein
MILFSLFFGLPFCFFLLLFNFLEGGRVLIIALAYYFLLE